MRKGPGGFGKRMMNRLTLVMMAVALVTILAIGFVSDGDPRKGQANDAASNVVVGKPATVAPSTQ